MKRILIHFLLLAPALLRAQEAPRIRNFAPYEYQAQNQVWALSQSDAGWIQAGNNEGMLEYDGTEWRRYALPDRQTVRAVARGKNGIVFCGGYAEFGYWAPAPDGRLAYRSLSADIPYAPMAKDEIWHILVTPEYVLFQSFATLYKYDYNKVTVLRPPNSVMFAQWVNGRVVVPVINRGLFELLPDGTFRFMPGTEALARHIVQFLIPDGKGGMWAGTTEAGMFEVRDGQCRPWQNPLNATFARFQLNKGIPLKDGGWAIGTILNGVYILGPEGALRMQLHRGNGLQNNTVLALLEDRDGRLWVGLDRGIDCVSLNDPLRFFVDRNGQIGTVYAAAVHNNRLYIGTNQGLFVRNWCPDAADCRGTFQLVEGTQGQVWELMVLGDQILCGHNSGTFLVSASGVKKISEITGGWSITPVPGKPDVLLQSTYTGLIVFRRAAGGAWFFSHRLEGLGEPLRKIAFDSAGNLWAVHPHKGLYRIRLSPDLNNIQEYQVFSRETGLNSDHQLNLAVLGNRLVINSSDGPLLAEERNGQWTFRLLPGATPTQRRLPGAGSDYFVVDPSGVRLQRDSGEWLFQVRLVPLYEHIAYPADNIYLFCTEDGFAILDTRRLGKSGLLARPAPVVLRGVILYSQGAEPQSGGPDAVFQASHTSLVFRFATPFFDKAPKFSWKLEGFADSWSEWQIANEKEFNNLPPGRYTFRVRSDTGGAETAYSFRIAPHWYQSGWMVLIYFALALAAAWFAERIYRRRLDRQRLRMEEENTRELVRQKGEAEREKLALEVDIKSRELSNSALNLVRKNEVLQHVKDALLEARKEDPKALGKLVRFIDQHLESDHDWQVFEESFSKVHDDFFRRLLTEFPDLTHGDLRLAAFLKLNLSSKEIAPLLNISVRGVENKRYRLRKKLGLPEDANLTEFMVGY